MENLSARQLKQLISTVFPYFPTDKKLAILNDVPDNLIQDNAAWKIRRYLAANWAIQLDSVKSELNLSAIDLIYFQNTHNNNANLPSIVYIYEGDVDELNFQKLCSVGSPLEIVEVFREYQILLAPTQFSATAPLKLAAREFGFRAATMPGFSPKMLPALKLNYDEINRRVLKIKALLDDAIGATITFQVENEYNLQLYLDLRFRQGHQSSGIFPEAATAGNLPSGECYIVPYEGEKGESSQSSGFLPVQFDDEVVIYKIEENKAVFVKSSGAHSMAEGEKVSKEPAYANLAELGFGILADFGIKPIGEILLDEKLGLHIAFGRSDHFGGAVGVKDFSNPFAVEHSDRIYIPETQPKIKVLSVLLHLPGNQEVLVMRDGKYRIF